MSIVSGAYIRELNGCCIGILYRVGSKIVSKCIDYALCHENFVTYRAMTAFGKTGCGTGCRYCGVDHFGVACGDNRLCNEDLVTFGTVLAFGKTGCGTGCCYCGVDGLI